MKYTVEHGHPAVDNVVYHTGLSKIGAIKLAKELAGGRKPVFISWQRDSDGQKGYLNPDGNHAVTGEAW